MLQYNNLSSVEIIKIYDVSGRLVHNSGNIAETTYLWSVNEVSSGVYFYVIESADGQRKTSGKIAVIR